TYAVVGFFCGLCIGPAYSWFLGALVPSLFTANLTFTIWAGLVIGGLGSRVGPLAGAFLVAGASELVRLIEVAPQHANIISAIHPLLIGLLLIIILRWRPDGLFTERGTFTRIGQNGFKLQRKITSFRS